MSMKLVSACLVGVRCAYDGNHRSNHDVLEQFKAGNLIPVCPEQLGGQPTPRSTAEICGGTGVEVLNGNAEVLEEDGTNVTESFIKGAHEVLHIAQTLGITAAIFKARSPSCGCGSIFDGTFSSNLVPGDGVTTALLKLHGITVETEEGS
jgi:uncharacterized protein YbbK (DUF523 family)